MTLKMDHIQMKETEEKRLQKKMLWEKGGASLHPHFQQGELSLLFFICICP